MNKEELKQIIDEMEVTYSEFARQCGYTYKYISAAARGLAVIDKKAKHAILFTYAKHKHSKGESINEIFK